MSESSAKSPSPSLSPSPSKEDPQSDVGGADDAVPTPPARVKQTIKPTQFKGPPRLQSASLSSTSDGGSSISAISVLSTKQPAAASNPPFLGSPNPSLVSQSSSSINSSSAVEVAKSVLKNHPSPAKTSPSTSQVQLSPTATDTALIITTDASIHDAKSASPSDKEGINVSPKSELSAAAQSHVPTSPSVNTEASKSPDGKHLSSKNMTRQVSIQSTRGLRSVFTIDDRLGPHARRPGVTTASSSRHTSPTVNKIDRKIARLTPDIPPCDLVDAHIEDKSETVGDDYGPHNRDDTSSEGSALLDEYDEDAIDEDNLHHPPSLTQEEYELLLKLEHQNHRISRSVGKDQRSSPVLFGAADLLNKVSEEAHDQKPKNLPENSAELEREFDWEFWGKLLNDFEQTLKKQNKALVKKIQSGLPKVVRGTVWHYFARSHPYSYLKFLTMHDDASGANLNASQSGSVTSSGAVIGSGLHAATSPLRERFKPPDAFSDTSLEDAYIELLKLSSPYEKMIVRDLARTFPKHDFFKHADGVGQESLFNVMKAYSLYDTEVGYCQGLSFIVGCLLLNMPDEQAFACLCHLMHTYHLRGLYTPRMELLQLRLYQFDRLLQELLPRVHDHLAEEGIRSTMYASQWFLTLFAYRFPLELVFRILDIIFAAGVVQGASGIEGGMMDGFMERMSESVMGASATTMAQKASEMGTETAAIMFRFAFALLKKNEEMILALDFEPLLEFLKHGLFEVYLMAGSEHAPVDGSAPAAAGTTADKPANSLSTSASLTASLLGGSATLPKRVQTPGGTTLNTANPANPSRNNPVPAQAVDELVKDAMQFRGINKKRLLHYRKDYEEELKKSDPTYLAEKSLEAQNQRLVHELKRAEKMLAELNRDHCDLAGQLVTIRLELAQEREVSHALKRQVHDLKSILNEEVGRLNAQEVQQMAQHEVTAENANEPLPTVHLPPPTSNKNSTDNDSRLPTVEEQVAILQNQNINLMEELAEWRSRCEWLEKQQVKGRTTTESPLHTGTSETSAWTIPKFLQRVKPALEVSSTPASAQGQRP